MNYYTSLPVHQRINAKANTIITFGKQNTPLMRQVKRGFICATGSMLKLAHQQPQDNYDGPGDDYYSGYYGGDWGKYAEDHRMIEAQKLK